MRIYGALIRTTGGASASRQIVVQELTVDKRGMFAHPRTTKAIFQAEKVT